VPFVSKAKAIPLAKIASRVMAGEKLSKFNLKSKTKNMFAVKEAVFPFNKFPNSDLILGPEMKSTGEVMGFDKDFGMAFAKSQIAAGNSLPTKGLAFIPTMSATISLSSFTVLMMKFKYRFHDIQKTELLILKNYHNWRY